MRDKRGRAPPLPSPPLRSSLRRLHKPTPGEIVNRGGPGVQGGREAGGGSPELRGPASPRLAPPEPSAGFEPGPRLPARAAIPADSRAPRGPLPAADAFPLPGAEPAPSLHGQWAGPDLHCPWRAARARPDRGRPRLPGRLRQSQGSTAAARGGRGRRPLRVAPSAGLGGGVPAGFHASAPGLRAGSRPGALGRPKPKAGWTDAEAPGSPARSLPPSDKFAESLGPGLPRRPPQSRSPGLAAGGTRHRPRSSRFSSTSSLPSQAARSGKEGRTAGERRRLSPVRRETYRGSGAQVGGGPPT